MRPSSRAASSPLPSPLPPPPWPLSLPPVAAVVTSLRGVVCDCDEPRVFMTSKGVVGVPRKRVAVDVTTTTPTARLLLMWRWWLTVGGGPLTVDEASAAPRLSLSLHRDDDDDDDDDDARGDGLARHEDIFYGLLRPPRMIIFLSWRVPSPLCRACVCPRGGAP
jgi:hypothetical protein